MASQPDKKRKTESDGQPEDTDFDCLIITEEELMDQQRMFLVPRKDLHDSDYDLLLNLSKTKNVADDYFESLCGIGEADHDRHGFLLPYAYDPSDDTVRRIQTLYINCFE